MTPASLVSETFTSVDAAWLRMDSPTNLAIITGVMSFDRPLEIDRVRDTILYRLCNYQRFRQRVRFSRLPVGLPKWETVPDFNVDDQLDVVRLPEPADHASLQEYVGELMSQPLAYDRPLWHAYFVENVNGGCALVIRLHHAIADGIALMKVLLNMTDEDADAPPPAPPQNHHHELSPLARLFRPALKTLKTARGLYGTANELVHESMDTLVHPDRWMDLARQGTASAKAFADLLLLPPDRRTIFRGNCGVGKVAAWSTTLEVGRVKAVGRKMGGTINDVLISALTGALRRYLKERDQSTLGLNIRAIVPVNLRPPDELEELGNRFGLVFLSMPVGVEDPLKRLVVLKRRMDEIKQSPTAVVALGILNAMGLTPIQIEKIIMMIFGTKGTAVVTNVPGPRQKLYLAGQELASLMFWVPSPANLGMGVSVLSYAGKIILGINTDSCLVPDPEAIIAHFQAEFEEMERWGRAAGESEEPGKEPEAAGPAPAVELDAAREALNQEASALLQAGLAALSGEPVESSSPANGRCHALTHSGKPCKNRALPGLETCRVHSL